MKTRPLGQSGMASRRRAVSGVVLLAATVGAALVTGPRAAAAYCDPLLNGTFTAASDGVWAKTNDVFHDETPVTSTWTVSSSCTADFDCAGKVISSEGWSAPMTCTAGAMWSVRRHLEHWEQCGDGTDIPGDQLIYFSPQLTGAPSYAAVTIFYGQDRTVGASGGCGINKPLVIEMPFHLTKTG
jgi:hypothetical protein